MTEIDLDAVKAAAERYLAKGFGIGEAAVLSDFAVAVLSRPCDFAEVLAGEMEFHQSLCRVGVRTAITPVGIYEISNCDGWYQWTFGGCNGMRCQDRETAYQACLLDYHNRLRAMLKGNQ